MMNKLVLTIIATGLLMTACNAGRPNINGGDSDQPIMDGWTFEQASEFWLASVLTDERTAVLNGEGEWLTPDSLAHLTKGHVRVKLPIHDGDPTPHWGVTYRQPQTGGFITFRDSAATHLTVSGDTLQSIGLAHYHFCDNMLPESADTTVFVQSRGKGLFTGFLMNRVRKHHDDGTWTWQKNGNPEWFPFIVSIYPGGDSLLVSRGLNPVEVFVIEKLGD